MGYTPHVLVVGGGRLRSLFGCRFLGFLLW